jgi:hypothetical protein
MKEKVVKFRYVGGPRKPGEWRTPEQLAQAYEDALRCRAEWRARKRNTAGSEVPAPQVLQPPDELKRRANFASGIARAEFGRFYWNGKTQAKPVSEVPAKGKPTGGTRVVPKRNGAAGRQ